ncbi:unnamed protein product [Fraxinus pennsylvanica]|uniref:Uncharacterized protein n=1 Tax=Fraxinus pennsylvanica TaxID=56036 RepID=A0AAD2E1E6_9LAMI|nr:unnamed protein product [Fraxinus pennsylvanica]
MIIARNQLHDLGFIVKALSVNGIVLDEALVDGLHCEAVAGDGGMTPEYDAVLPLPNLFLHCLHDLGFIVKALSVNGIVLDEALVDGLHCEAGAGDGGMTPEYDAVLPLPNLFLHCVSSPECLSHPFLSLETRSVYRCGCGVYKYRQVVGFIIFR